MLTIPITGAVGSRDRARRGCSIRRRRQAQLLISQSQVPGSIRARASPVGSNTVPSGERAPKWEFPDPHRFRTVISVSQVGRGHLAAG